VNETVDTLLDNIEQQSGSLYGALENGILKLFKISVRRSDWNDELPNHLRPRFVVIDSDGKELSSGRDLAPLQTRFKIENNSPQQTQSIPEIRRKEQAILDRWQGTEYSDWNFYDLPAMLTIYTKGGETAGLLYTALFPQPEKMSVKIVFEKDRDRAEHLNQEGLLLLYRCHFNDHYKALKKLCSTTFSGPSALWLFSFGKSRQETIHALLQYIMATIFGPLPLTIQNERSFREKILQVQQKGLFNEGERLCQDIMNLLKKRRVITESIRQMFGPKGKKSHFLPDKQDAFLACLDAILPASFLFTLQPTPLQNIDRE
jgi:ATP-dependent helicase HrpA